MIWAGVIGNVTRGPRVDRPAGHRQAVLVAAGRHAAGRLRPRARRAELGRLARPGPERPYLDTYKEGKFKGKRVYQPFVWRGWWDFGTGALGDIGCHAMSGTFTALKIEHAAAVELVKDSGDDDRRDVPQLVDHPLGHSRPGRACRRASSSGTTAATIRRARSASWPTGKEYPDNGTIVVGDKGKLSFHGYAPRLMPEAKMKDFKQPAPDSSRAARATISREWVTACKGGRPAFSNFDHAGPLTELVLLGNLAIRAGVGKQRRVGRPAT